VEVQDIVVGKDNMKQDRFSKSDIITDVSDLSEDQKDIIAVAMSKEWTTPEFKVKNFIGNAQITPFAKLRQYIIEMNTREHAVQSMEYEVKKIELEIELEQERANETQSPAQKKIHELEKLKLNAALKRSQLRLQDAYTERDMYLKIIDEFNNSPAGRLPDGRRIIDVLEDPEVSDQLEKEYWTLRLAKQTALDMIAYGRAGVGNMEAVTMLEPVQQAEVMKIACEYFVINELRTNQMLSSVNEAIQQGKLLPSELSKQLLINQDKQDVPTIQNSQ
jgi:hypothetical protein